MTLSTVRWLLRRQDVRTVDVKCECVLTRVCARAVRARQSGNKRTSDAMDHGEPVGDVDNDAELGLSARVRKALVAGERVCTRACCSTQRR
jgi:hypothetical protein